MRKIRLCVIDDQNVVREGLVALLSYQSDIEVLGQAEDGIKGLELIQQTQPDVVLLDLEMPRQDGMTTIRKMKEQKIKSRVLVLTSFGDSEHVQGAIKAGAIGYMLKDATREQLMQAIYDVNDNKPALHSSAALNFIKGYDPDREETKDISSLTKREKIVLQYLAEGMSNQEIAGKMGITVKTVAKYVSKILSKLHLSNRTQAALYLVKK